MLRIAADAEFQQVDKQQQRLLREIELYPLHVNGAFGLKFLTKEEVLQAARLVDMPDSRLLEELFWVHAIDGDLRGEPSAILLAVRRQPPGPEATHNLAVLQTLRGQESEPSAWEEALKEWKRLLNDAPFWDFMKERAVQICARNGHAPKLKAEVSRRLSAALAAQLVLAGKAKDVNAVTLLARIIIPHRDWLDLDRALRSVGQQVCREGFVSLGAVLDRVPKKRTEENEATTRRALAQAEKELGSIVAAYSELMHSLGEMAFHEGWTAAVSSSYQQLRSAWDEIEHASRQVQWQVLYREASALLQSGHYAAAERKIAEARAFCTGKQDVDQLDHLLQTCGYARAAAEEQQRLQQRDQLYSEAKACLWKGELAAAEEKLAAAMSFSREEEQREIEEMQERCHWMRLLRGVDTDRTCPWLYRLNGIGTTFLGRRDADSRTDSYLTDHWFTLLFIPIYPLGTYRVSDAGDGAYCIYGRAPLSPLLKKARWVIPAVVLSLALAAMFIRGSARKAGVVAPPVATAHPLPPLSDDLAPERNAVTALAQSLSDRQRMLKGEELKLERQRASLQTVAVAYHGEVVPHAGRAVYDALLGNYNNNLKQHESKLVRWRADEAAYRERANALHAREGAK